MMHSRESELRKFVAPEFVFGVGSLQLAGQYGRNLGGSKALVVSDPGVVAAGWAQQVLASVEAAGLESTLFTQVTPNPRFDEVTADRQIKRKLLIISKAVVPDISLIDPATLTTMDAFLSACTGMDALIHALEAYVSLGHSPLTDNHALQAMRLISSNLQKSIAEPNNLDYRTNMMLGSL